MINEFRRDSRSCAGEAAPATGPLAPVAALAGVDATSAEAMQRSLSKRGYLAAQVQLVSISGPANADEAMQFLEQRYCKAVSNPEHAEIGVAKTGNRWQIVLAKPLLSASLRDPEQAGHELFRLTNLARSQARRCGDVAFEPAPPMRWDASLASAALAHSRDMAGQDYFAHRAPDGSQVSDRASRAGYAWRTVGENLAAGQGSAESAMAAWLASPGHCKNIMSRSFSEMGASYVINRNSETVIYWTQVLASPRARGAGPSP